MDSADQRYYSNQFGRFMTPDPYRATVTSPSDPRSPQSFNRYSYVIGDPMNLIDPQGTTYCFVNPTTGVIESCYDSTDVNATIDEKDQSKYYFISLPDLHYIPGSAGARGKEGDTDVPDKPAEKESSQTQCVNSFYNSTLGGAVKFLSVINLLQNLGSISTVLEWTLLPAAKVAAISVIQDLSSVVGNTDFYSVAGTSQTASIETELGAALNLLKSPTAAPLLFSVVPIATAIDAGVQQMCSAVRGLRFNSQ